MTKKALNLPILISLVVGNMIGTGIYLLPASLASFGTISLLSWFYTSVGAILLALTFTQLTKRFPKTGGPYVYCKEAFGKPIGFVVAYTYLLSNLASIAGLAVSSIGYMGFLSPLLDANHASYQPLLVFAIELIALWGFTLINILGLHTAGIVQVFLTIIKILPLLVISVVGLFSMHLPNLTQFTLTNNTSHMALIGSAAALTFWSFIGLESATVPAENTRGFKDIYKATLFGTSISAFIYILSTFVLMGMIPVATLQHSQFPFADAATLLFGKHAAIIVAICAIISGLGALNVCVLVQGQIVFAASRDHLFPRLFAKLSKRNVPVFAQLVSSLCVSLFLLMTIQPSLLKQFNYIALIASLLTLITYLMTALSEIKFQLAEAHVFKRVSFFIAILSALYAVWMIASFEKQIILAGLFVLLCCVPIYYLTVRKYMTSKAVAMS